MRISIDIARRARSLWQSIATVIVMLFFHLPLHGNPVDSLYLIWMNTDARSKTETANQFFRQLHQAQFTDSLIQFEKRAKLADVESKVHYWMSEYLFDQERYEDALNAGNKARLAMEPTADNRFKSDVLGIIVNSNFRLGNYDQMLIVLNEVYQLDKKIGDKNLISSDLNTFAAIYVAIEQPAQGIKYIEKAIALERELERRDRLAIRLGTASELYLLNNETDKAMAAIDEAYHIDTQDDRQEKAAIRLVQKAAILDKMSRPNEARQIIKQALPVLEKADNTYSLAVAYNQLASIESQQGNNDEAIALYKRALEQSIKCGSPKTERTAERGLWLCMRDINPSVAMLHLERYTVLNDSLHNKLMSMQIKVMGNVDQQMGMTDIDKKSHLFDQLLKWGGLSLLILLSLTLAVLFLAWRRNKDALRMQRHTQEMKAHFFTNITNKLQEPLTVVLSAGQQLIEGTVSDAEQERHLGSMIVNHGRNMLALVNQMTDIENARSDINDAELKYGNIVMFIRMLVDNYADAANQNMISLSFSSSSSIIKAHFSNEHIRKIVHILIDNAIKYTPPNGKINVNLSLPESGKIRLTISDTGKGIPVEEQGNLFDPFLQSDNGDDGVETVLSLSLVRQLVEAINGTIKVHSEVGKGTTFTIEFPPHTSSQATAMTNEEETAQHFAEKRIRQSRNMKQRPLVFIVENNEEVAFFIANHLRENYELRFARDGREALIIARDLVPDLVITNTIMPVMDGKELIRHLRDDATLKHIPIIAMTSNMNERERISCIEAGADSVLVKPFNSTELRLIAAHLINQLRTLQNRVEVTSSEIFKEDASTPMSKEDKDFLVRLVDIIHAQMANDEIDIDHIAAALSLSRKQLRTRVMTLTGKTPVAYILQVRLNYARRMISSENKSLTEIANRCGFQNLSHFSKAFKQHFNISPTQFRKNIDNISPI